MNLIHTDTLLQLAAALAVLIAWLGLAGVALHALQRLGRRGRTCSRPGQPPLHTSRGREPSGENLRRQPVGLGTRSHGRT